MSVQVTGLNEFNRAIRRVGDEFPDRMQRKLVMIAARIAGRIANKLPHVSGHAAGSVRPQATSKGAAILAGGRGAPYFQWLDFGGSVGRGHQRGATMGAIHRTWMGKPGGSGRYVYPTISEMKPQTIAAIDDALRDLAKAAGFETSGELP